MAKKTAKRFGWGWVNKRGQLVKKNTADSPWGFGAVYNLALTRKRDAEDYRMPGERVVRVEIREV
jgi:hypothetical protein